MIVHVDVTQEDISNGTVSYVACPVALALVRALRELKVELRIAMATSRRALYIGTDCVFHQTTLPKAAVGFIAAFDHNEAVQPLSFDLDFRELR